MSNCDCELPEFMSISVHKARKQHRCCECGRTIEPGEEYEAISGKWDGYFSYHKTCDDCCKVRDHLSRLSDCCMCIGGLFEELFEGDYLSSTRLPDGTKKYTSLVDWLEITSHQPLRVGVNEVSDLHVCNVQ